MDEGAFKRKVRRAEPRLLLVVPAPSLSFPPLPMSFPRSGNPFLTIKKEIGTQKAQREMTHLFRVRLQPVHSIAELKDQG